MISYRHFPNINEQYGFLRFQAGTVEHRENYYPRFDESGRIIVEFFASGRFSPIFKLLAYGETEAKMKEMLKNREHDLPPEA